MRHFLWPLAMVVFVALTFAANPSTPTKKKTPAKKTTASKGASSKNSATSKKSTAGKKKTATKGTWRNRQMTPSPDRYRDIQNALAAKGFLSPEDATGVWNQNSVEALKRFQSAQNIESSGKINSLSLIALGLGPKREAGATPTPPKQE